MSLELSGPDPRLLFADGSVQDTAFGGYGPMFSAQRATIKPISNAQFGALLPDLVEVDTHGFYDPVLGYYQPTIPGWYSINYGASFTGTGILGALVCLYNAAGLLTVGQHVGGDTGRLSASRLLAFNGTSDKIAPVVYVSGTGSDFNISTGPDSFFQANFVRPLP